MSNSDRPSWLPTGVRALPVVVIHYAPHARGLCTALAAGGIPCAEITLRTEGALDAIAAAARLDDFVVGAGTVLNAAQARDAIAAGARFLVSPGFDEGVLAAGADAGVPVVPGIATATEAQRAVNAGVRTVKFFPAATSGGINAVQALSAPFSRLRFIPTGGISLTDAPAWLRVPSVVAVGGSWLAPPDAVQAGRFDAIERIARDTVRTLSSPSAPSEI